jgi:hypothetical protein
MHRAHADSDGGLRAPAAGELDNAMRWDGASPGHYEVWYLTLSHRPSETGFWIRYTLKAPTAGHGEPYAQLWFACFDARDPQRTFGLNRMVPIGALSHEREPFSVDIDGSRITHQSASGHLCGRGHEVRWDLAWLPSEVTHRQLPPLMYLRGGLGETTVLSPNLSVPIHGTIEVDGRRLDLAGEPGGQTHLWGRRHALSWGWGHCNAFDGAPDAAFETLTAKIRRGGVTLPYLTALCLYLDGEAFRWNQPWHLPMARGELGTCRYAFRASKPTARIEGEYRCRPEDMVVAHYEDPDGTPRYCANTEVADLRLTLWRRGLSGRWLEARRLVAPHAGHFEIGGRRRDPALPRDHETIDDRGDDRRDARGGV